jgi:hypothetical protein
VWLKQNLGLQAIALIAPRREPRAHPPLSAPGRLPARPRCSIVSRARARATPVAVYENAVCMRERSRPAARWLSHE